MCRREIFQVRKPNFIQILLIKKLPFQQYRGVYKLSHFVTCLNKISILYFLVAETVHEVDAKTLEEYFKISML